MTTYTIEPLDVGTMYGDKSSLTYGRHHCQRIAIPSVIWLLRKESDVVVVDTGVSSPEWATPRHELVTRETRQEPEIALARAGVDPLAVRLVVITHLHWDHASNTQLFSNADVIVHKEELAYASAPLPTHVRGYEWSAGSPGAYIASTRFTPIDSDVTVRPGIEILHTPGHTPGSISVAVATTYGLAIIAGDIVPLFENWTTGDAALPHVHNPDHTNLAAYYATFDKIDRRHPAIVLPSHDIRVFDDPSSWAPWSTHADEQEEPDV